jgi:hypothetical protein
MNRIAIVASLRDGAQPEARALLEHGPPFDLARHGFERHVVFLSAGEVVFTFEGPNVEWLVDDLVEDPFRWAVTEALATWRPLIAGPPRVAREAFAWERTGRDPAPPGPRDGGTEPGEPAERRSDE